MKKIDYQVPLLRQGFQDCVQASAAQILNFCGVRKTINEIKKEVPVFISKDGLPLGSSIGHIATYFLQLSFKVTMHIVDVEIFDRSWVGFSNRRLIENLKQRRKFIKHPRYNKEALDIIFEGYINFLKSGGIIKFPIIDREYLLKLLEKGPIYASVSFNFLNSISKYKFINSKKSVKDSIKGSPGSHAVVISGFKNNQFKIVDPDPKFGGIKWIDSGHLIGSIYLAETDLDALLITLEK